MSDERRFERDARAWLEQGPAHAPDRAVQAALTRIETTPQERDVVPRRLHDMSVPARLALAAVLVIAVGGGAYFAFRGPQANVAGQGSTPAPTEAPGAVSPTPAAASDMEAYRAARNALCVAANNEKAPLIERVPRAIDPAASDAERADGIAAIEALVALIDTLTAELEALAPPPDLLLEHAANVTQYRDVATLLRYELALLADGNVAEAGAVDRSTDSITSQIGAWELRHKLLSCP